MIASTVTVQDNASDLVTSLGNVTTNLRKELRIVSWKVSGKTKSLIAKEVTKELAVAQKVVRRHLKAKRVEPTGALVRLEYQARIPLRDYKARQTKKGVSYKISKTKGRSKIASAFIVNKLGNHVFVRSGKSRLPIRKLYGPSPWGVFVVNKMTADLTPKVKSELTKQLAERLRFKTLKQSGAI